MTSIGKLKDEKINSKFYFNSFVIRLYLVLFFQMYGKQLRTTLR